MSPTSSSSRPAPAKDWTGFEDASSLLSPRSREPTSRPATGSGSARPVDPGSSTGQPARHSSGSSRNGELTGPAPLPVVVTDRWEGVITEVGDEYFVGELARTYGAGPDLVAEFNLDAVDDDDRPLVQPGAWFYVIIGRVRGPGNRASTVSTLRFRRLPTWRDEELEGAKERAAKRRLQLGLDAGD